MSHYDACPKCHRPLQVMEIAEHVPGRYTPPTMAFCLHCEEEKRKEVERLQGFARCNAVNPKTGSRCTDQKGHYGGHSNYDGRIEIFMNGTSLTFGPDVLYVDDETTHGICEKMEAQA